VEEEREKKAGRDHARREKKSGSSIPVDRRVVNCVICHYPCERGSTMTGAAHRRGEKEKVIYYKTRTVRKTRVLKRESTRRPLLWPAARGGKESGPCLRAPENLQYGEDQS